MKNNKMLKVGLLGLIFGLFSQAEAFYFRIDNNFKGEITVELLCKKSVLGVKALPASVSSIPLLKRTILLSNESRIAQLTCGSQDVILNVYFGTQTGKDWRFWKSTSVITKGTGPGEKNIAVSFNGRTVQALVSLNNVEDNNITTTFQEQEKSLYAE